MLGCVAVWLVAIVSGQVRSGPGFLLTVADQSAPLVPMALGAAIVLSVGELDLSISGTFSFFGMFLLYAPAFGLSPAAAYSAGFGIAGATGLLIGLLVVYLRISAIVVSLGIALVFAGTAVVFDSLLSSRMLSDSVTIALFAEYGLGLSIMFVVAVLLWVRFSPSGLGHLAVGYDRSAGYYAGLPVDRQRLMAFVMSSLMTFFSAVLYANILGGWNAKVGVGKGLGAIATAVLGGTLITGGRLEPINVLVATVLWGSFFPLISVLDLRPELQEVALGVVLTGAAFTVGRSQSTIT